MATRVLWQHILNPRDNEFSSGVMDSCIDNKLWVLFRSGYRVSFIYDNDTSEFHPSEAQPSNLFSIIQVRPFTEQDIKTLLSVADYAVVYTNDKRWFENYERRGLKVPDWSQTITDLEKASIVSTVESTQVMCTDPRSFTFEGETYEVDILGTSLFSDLTDKIKDKWVSIFETKMTDTSKV